MYTFDNLKKDHVNIKITLILKIYTKIMETIGNRVKMDSGERGGWLGQGWWP